MSTGMLMIILGGAGTILFLVIFIVMQVLFRKQRKRVLQNLNQEYES